MLDILENVFNYTLIHATIRSSTPIVLATIAVIITKQADILNLAVEGTMLIGAFVATAVSFATGSWVLAVLASIVAGLLISLILSVAHLKYKADIFAAAIAINMLAPAITKFFLHRLFNETGSLVSEKIVMLPILRFKLLNQNEILDSLFNNYSILEILSIVLVFVSWYLIYKTVWGLRLRSVGLNPMAAETAGINIVKTKYMAMLYSGILGGIAGAHLSIGYANLYADNMVNGRGFMGVAAMFFGAANPITSWIGCLIFGFSDSVGTRLQAYGMPSQFILMIPYFITIAVLSISMINYVNKEKKIKSSLYHLTNQ